MWVKLDDGYTEHLKLFEAGRHLGGRFGYARALAIDMQGMCYANRAESDGFLPEKVVKSFHDPKPLDVAHVLVMVRRWREVPGGYQIHDYAVYQPLAATLKAKRAADLDRKKKAKGAKRGAEFRAESAKILTSPDPVPVPSLQKDHRRASRDPVENAKVLKALIWRETHAAYADRGESWDAGSLTERIKRVAGAAHVLYDVEGLRDQIETAMDRVAARRRATV